MSDPAGRPTDYGVDAPGVIRGMLGGGAAALAAGSAMSRFGQSSAARWGGAAVAIAAAAPLGLALAMIGYAGGGKQRLREWMLARHSWRGDERVLDIGAGRGLMAIGAAKCLTSGRVVALDLWRPEDLSSNGPDALLSNAVAEGVADRLDIVTGDAAAPALPADGFEVILSVLCLHNIDPVERRVRACEEIARMLAPGGKALIADYAGTALYARTLREAGLIVDARHNLVRLCRSLMWVVEAHKPVPDQAASVGGLSVS